MKITHSLWRRPDFHIGIDYPQVAGTPIQAVEGGVITNIGIDSHGDYLISVQGNHARWSYLHIFSNLAPGESLPILDSGWKLSKVQGAYQLTRPQLDSVYGKKVFTQGTVVLDHEPIAPVGNSGLSTGPHLHLQRNGGTSNSLYNVIHPKGPATFTFEEPEDGEILPESELASFSVTVDLDDTSGKDIDTVDIFVDGVLQPFPGADENTFRFGGFPGETPIGMVYSADGDGVEPTSNVFQPKFHRVLDLSGLSVGSHQLCAEGINVNLDEDSDNCISFGIDRTSGQASITSPNPLIPQRYYGYISTSGVTTALHDVPISGTASDPSVDGVDPGLAQVLLTLRRTYNGTYSYWDRGRYQA